MPHSKNLEQELRKHVRGEVFFDPLSRELHSTDASIYRITPLGVVAPRTQDDVVRTVQLCGSHGTPLTARGSGTSLAGQAIGAGIQVDFSRFLNRILELNPEQGWVRVEPGVVLDNLNGALAPHGLQFGADVATSSRATLGGMIGNNSSGARSIVQGVTADHIMGLKVVLSDSSVAELVPLTGKLLEQKLAQPTLESSLYREIPALARENAEQIARRFPRIPRCVSGYNLNAFIDASAPVDLTRMIAGSEGTLALILEAKLKLTPAPAARALLLIEFADVLAAAAAVSPILEHAPAAVELVDRLILDQTPGSAELAEARRLLQGRPGAVLIVECLGNSSREVEQAIMTLAVTLGRRGIGSVRTPIVDPIDQKRFWELRKAGVGLLMALKGDAKPYAFVEDAAVAPDRLEKYLERFQQIVAAHDTYASWYGHAGAGCLHVRPVINLKSAEGRDKLRSMLDQVSNLVLELGGSLSGEHGDGILRGAYLEKMFGAELYQAFRRVKKLFDPAGVLNPGRIVDTPDLLQNLRVLSSVDKIPEVNTRLDYSEDGGFYRAVEMCSGVGHCRKTFSGSMCPSFMATGQEGLSTRGRSNALLAALEGRLPGGLGNPELYRIMDLCLGCKACKSECPSFVDMTKHKQELLYQRHRLLGAPTRSRIVGNIDRFLPLLSALASPVNRLLRLESIRWLNEKLLGFDRRRVFPFLARRSFRRQFLGNRARPGAPARGEVVLHADCWSNHCRPEAAMAAVKLLEATGHAVRVAETRCCGRPALSQGLLDRAAKLAEHNVAVLHQHLAAGRAVVGVEPSCLSTVRDEYLYLLSGPMREKAREVASRVRSIDEFLAELPEEVWRRLAWETAAARVLVHGHCHQKALGGMKPLESLLKRVPGIDLKMLDTSCCGMAGSFGYEVEHYEMSRACVERVLAPAVREAGQSAIVLATGFSCCQQIEHFTGVPARHPVEMLADLLRPGN